MNLQNASRLVLVAGLLLGTCAVAAVRPIASTTEAARATASTLLIREDLQNVEYQFAFRPRDLMAGTLAELANATSFEALLQTPGGIVVNCPASGSFLARLPNRRPRVLSIDWRRCARLEFGLERVHEGPAELVLIEDSFTPTALASIRFGDRGRDHVETLLSEASTPTYVVYRNLKLTGYLPLLRLGDNSIFAGRLLAQVTGFSRALSYLPDYSTGVPSEELYVHENQLNTSGALIGVQNLRAGNGHSMDVSILAGDFTERYVRPATPTTPEAGTFRKSFGGTGLRAVWGLDDTVSRYYLSIDGVARTNYNEWWAFGCSKPDEFSYRTRARLEHIPGDYTGHMFDSGLLSINGGTSASFSATGTIPYLDRVGQVVLTIPGVAQVTYAMNGFIYGSELMQAGVCTN